MPGYDYDLITIGAGSGGVRASRIAAGHGAKVAVIEEDRPGGTCVLRGCVPKKLLVYGSQYPGEFEDAAGFGWSFGGGTGEGATGWSHDWGRLIADKNTELDRLSGIYRDTLAGAGAELIDGRGVVTGAHTVDVGGREVTAERILVAVGGWPHMLPVDGLAEHGITSNEALELDRFPDEIAIFGAGYIAVEFAGIFNGFGARTHLIYRAEEPLRGFDGTMRSALAESMAARGVILHPGCTVERVEGDGGGKRVTLSDGSVLEVGAVMAATGRRPKTEGLGLEAAGVELDKAGAVPVNAESQSATPSIYAIGDVTNRVNLTPVAIAEGHAFADHVYGGMPNRMDHANIPSAVFSQPPVGSVGMAEEAAGQAGIDAAVYVSRFNAMRNTISGRDEKTVMKLVVDKATDKVVGAHMIGPDAPEIIQGVAIAVKTGATKADFDATIGIHPTAAEEFTTMREAGGG